MRSFDPDLIDEELFWEDDSLVTDLIRAAHRFEGKSPKEVFADSGQLKQLENRAGACWFLTSSRRGSFARWPQKRVRTDLFGTTCLVLGIRDRTSNNLASLGFADLDRLTRHPRFGEPARKLCKLIHNARTGELAKHIRKRLSSSHPLLLRLTGLHNHKDFLFLDLETMGLFGGQPVIVAGLCRSSAGNIVQLRQFICRDHSDERALLAAVRQELNRSGVLVTFNGSAFDLPFLQQRCGYYGLPQPAFPLHIDLLPICRRTWGQRLDSCSLRVLEQEILDIQRDIDLPGEAVPEFYRYWCMTSNSGFLRTIVDHNRNDLTSLVKLFTAVIDYWARKDRR